MASYFTLINKSILLRIELSTAKVLLNKRDSGAQSEIELSPSLSSAVMTKHRPRFHWQNWHEHFEQGYQDDDEEDHHTKVKKKTFTSFVTTFNAFSTTTVVKSFTLVSSSITGLLCLPAGYEVC